MRGNRRSLQEDVAGSIRPEPPGLRVRDQPDARRPNGGREVQRAGIAGHEQSRPSRKCSQLTQGQRRHEQGAPARCRDDVPGRPALPVVQPLHDQRREPMRISNVTSNGGETIRWPHLERRTAGVDERVRLLDDACVANQVRDRASIPRGFRYAEARLRRAHAERRENLEVPVHDVAGRRLDEIEMQRACDRARKVVLPLRVRDESSQFVADHPDKSEPPGRAGQERRKDGAAHPLQIEDRVEPQGPQFAPQAENLRQ